MIRKNNFLINTGDNLTLEQRKLKIEKNKERYGLPADYVKKLKIPKLLSQSIGHYLTLKQIGDPKNNLTIVEKIEQLKRLIKSMTNKLRIIDKVEQRRKEDKLLQRKTNHSNEIELSEINTITILKKEDGFCIAEEQ